MKKLFLISVLSLLMVFAYSNFSTVSAATSEIELIDQKPTPDGTKTCCNSKAKCDKTKCDPAKCTHKGEKKCAGHTQGDTKSACCKSKTTTNATSEQAAPVKKCCSSHAKPSTPQK